MNARHLTVIGAGYVGLATAIGLAVRGHEIEVVEVRADRRGSLQRGVLPIHEPGMDKAYARPEVRARIRAVAKMGKWHRDGIMICVGTPVQEGGRSDLTQLEAALRMVRPYVADGVPMVIRSTMPPGATGQVTRWANGDRSRIFINPEFLRQGTALEDFLEPTRVVIGRFPEADAATLDMVIEIFRVEDAPLLVVGVAEAELIKNGANAYLALKLSFTNEISALSEELGADVSNVLEGLGFDPRLGKQMQPSFGFGGSCLPKELKALTNTGRDLGIEMHVTSAASEANEAHQRRFARRIVAAAGPKARRIGLLGLAFKAGTDDVRYSPALRVAQLLLDRGLVVVAYDPHAAENAARELPQLQIAASAMEAIEGADAAVIATEWPELRDLNWGAAGERMACRVIVDGRRLLDPEKMVALGFDYQRIGGPAPVAGGPATDVDRAADIVAD